MIPLFSDTATKPSRGMLEAMASAPLGDEQRRDDPSVNQLEAEAARLLKQEAALLLPTATMANQIGIALLTRPGTELACHQSAHVYNFEAGGVAAHSGVQVRPLEGPGGTFSGEAVSQLLRPRDPHIAPLQAVSVENTSNLGGGTVWGDEPFFSVVDACRRHNLGLHIDGARLFNAAVKRGVPVSHWSEHADTVQLCFSKGLGCPFGAILASTAENIARARDLKQRYGGALRQAGIIAGAMLYALEHHVAGLAKDHLHLEHLAAGLEASGQFELWPFETNILYFRPNSVSALELSESLRANGVDVSHLSGRLRACTHRDVQSEQIDQALRTLLRLVDK